ncbi:transcriptional regulator [Photobacterium phosphoreum]|uniref:helix-turn-helix domain-containing protein n=1 Tax=Photobacterium phosphoreum TaxID=659 RepID=UPI000D16301F|nr:helix-turn-helix transcriptional regulator [Photobacterium phosphoreum]PSU69134.1 transcriptional regulator [Photobacterium phosphoreum]PSW10140.1 transcriptional regulator [Photobacterium phosphoreum]
MSISVAEKIRIMRDSERLTRRAMSEITGIPYSSLSNYELDKGEMGFRAVQKLLKNDTFNKYTNWFLFDRTNPEAGQISPALAHTGRNATTLPPSDQNAG